MLTRALPNSNSAADERRLDNLARTFARQETACCEAIDKALCMRRESPAAVSRDGALGLEKEQTRNVANENKRIDVKEDEEDADPGLELRL